MNKENVDPRLFDLLDELKSIPPRDTHAAARGRARFLAEAVSLGEKQRHNVWKLFPYKEKLTMNFLISALVIVGLLFGSSATVSAAQDDLPNQPLYQLKLMSEEAHLWFTSDPVQQIDMLMDQEQIRLQEMQTLTAQGIIPPTDGAVRAKERIQRALQIISQLDEASQLAKLQQIRDRLHAQDRQMLQLEQGTCKECIPVLQQTREMLQLHLGQVENGLTNPSELQDQNQTQMQDQNQLRINQTPWITGTAIPPYGTCTPALDGASQQNGNDSPSVTTPIQQQNQTQQQNQGGGGSQTGSGSGSPTGSGGQSGKP